VSHALVPVSASDKEHGCTVGNGTDNGTASDDGTGLVDSTASANVASHGTAITRSTGRGSTWFGGRIGRTVVTRQLASGQRTCCVDQCREIVYRRILVVPEGIGRIAELSRERRLQILRNSEHG
jgi:hypothetical protein